MPHRALWIALAAPFVAAFLIPLVPRRMARSAGFLAAATAALSTIIVAGLMTTELPVRVPLAWIPRLGIHGDLLFDGFSAVFSLIIAGAGTLIFFYGGFYLGAEEDHRRFFSLLLLFMGAMLGIVLAANLIAMYVFWELTTVSSFLLIGFWYDRDAARAAALKSLVITATGGLGLLVGIVLLGIVGGSYDVVELATRQGTVLDHPLYGVILGLFLFGAFTKSAQVPFHIWLPDAMEAPTPVSAFLHSATMVKAGLFLCARMLPVLGGTPEWSVTVTGAGLVTLCWGAWLAVRQDDLKRLLAFSTVSQLGLILSLFGLGTKAAVAAGFWHLVNHAAFKGALFLLVGIIEHETGTRDRSRLAPLASRMPVTAALVVVSALSMAGIPLLGGFVSKEMALDAFLGAEAPWPSLGTLLLAAGSVLTVAYSLLLAHGVAWAGARGGAEAHHDPGAGFLLGPVVLASLSVLFGLFPSVAEGVLSQAATAIRQAPVHAHPALWHGFTPALGVSAIVVASGVAVYALVRRRILAGVPGPAFCWNDVYDAGLVGLDRFSRALTYSHMTGRLRHYAVILLGAFVFAEVLGWWRAGGLPSAGLVASPISVPAFLGALAVAVFAVATARARTRLAAVVSLGGVGFGLSLLFVLLGAPDLALTQLLVETVSIVLFLSVFVFLPVYPPVVTPRSGRALRAAGSGLVGLIVAGNVYVALSQRSFEVISTYFLKNSHDLAGGDNVVNVILVDFRGLDTLGEITVLGIAALGVFALVRLKLGRKVA